MPPKSAQVEPLSTERYRVEFTATAALKEKLDRAANLMRHGNPNGDLSLIVERALDVLIERLEKRQLGKARRPRTRTTRKSVRRGYITRAVRRRVFARDGERCTFVDESGRRCTSEAFLELDHVIPRARQGTGDATNVRVMCRAHNDLLAERDFGRAHMEKKKADRSRQAEHEQASEKLDPRQRGDQGEVALKALVTMGFKQEHARRALQSFAQRWGGRAPPPLETVLRETIAILT